MGLGQTGKSLVGLLGCSSRGSKPSRHSLGPRSLLGAWIPAASPQLPLYSLLFCLLWKCWFFPTNCLFPYDLPLKSGYGPSHDLLPLQLCHYFVSTPKLLSEITALKIPVLVLPVCMLLPSGEKRVIAVNTEVSDCSVRVLPKRTFLGSSIVVLTAKPTFLFASTFP